MSAETFLALVVSLLGNPINFGLLVIHCRRDKRLLSQIRDDK